MIKSNSFFTVNAFVLSIILQFLLNKIFLKLGIIIKKVLIILVNLTQLNSMKLNGKFSARENTLCDYIFLLV